MDNNVIGQRINTALAWRRKKQKELAAYLGVKDNVISYFCKGSRTPNTEQVIEISKYLDVSTDWLFGFSEYNQYEKRFLRVETLGLSEAATLCLEAMSKKKYEGVRGKPISYIDIVNALMESEAFEELIEQVIFVEATKRDQIADRIKQEMEYEGYQEDRPKISDSDLREVRFAEWAASENFLKIVNEITEPQISDLLKGDQ